MIEIERADSLLKLGEAACKAQGMINDMILALAELIKYKAYLEERIKEVPAAGHSTQQAKGEIVRGG